MATPRPSSEHGPPGRLWVRALIALIALVGLVALVVGGFKGGFAPVALIYAVIVVFILPGFVRNGAGGHGDHCSRETHIHNTEVKP